MSAGTGSIVRGVDHVGITVPDIDAATDFFVRAFDAVFVADWLERTPPDQRVAVSAERSAMLARALGVPAGTDLVAIRSLRIGDAACVELFEYVTPEPQRSPVIPSDLGIQHLCFYVDDIDAAAERVVAAGGELVSEPVDLPGAESGEGNRWVYTRSPWGSTIELVTYPSPQPYEALTSVRRWRPPPRPAGS